MIAKYRREGFPGEWYLTDFTMGQVEGRIADLETKNARLRSALRECMEAMGKDCIDYCYGGPDHSDKCAKEECKWAELLKYREVLGDETPTLRPPD